MQAAGEPPPPSLEPFAPADRDAVLALYEGAFRRLVTAEGWQQTLDELETGLGEGGWVAREDGRVVAFGRLEPLRSRTSRDSVRMLLRWWRSDGVDAVFGEASALTHGLGDARPVPHRHPAHGVDWWALQPAAGVLSALIVHPEHRRRGLGKALVRRRIEEARRQGMTALFVHCTAGTGVEHLYEAEGFLPILDLAPYYHDGTGLRLMGLPLEAPPPAPESWDEQPASLGVALRHARVHLAAGLALTAGATTVAPDATPSQLAAWVVGAGTTLAAASLALQPYTQPARRWFFDDRALVGRVGDREVARVHVDAHTQVSVDPWGRFHVERNDTRVTGGRLSAADHEDLLFELWVRTRAVATRTSAWHADKPALAALVVALGLLAAWAVGSGGGVALAVSLGFLHDARARHPDSSLPQWLALGGTLLVMAGVLAVRLALR